MRASRRPDAAGQEDLARLRGFDHERADGAHLLGRRRDAQLLGVVGGQARYFIAVLLQVRRAGRSGPLHTRRMSAARNRHGPPTRQGCILGACDFGRRSWRTGKTAAGIEIPATVVDALGTSRKPPVGQPSTATRTASTVAHGQRRCSWSASATTSARPRASPPARTSTSTLELDTEPREVAVPPDLAAALDADPEARAVLREPLVQQQAPDRRADRRREDARDARSAGSRSPWRPCARAGSSSARVTAAARLGVRCPTT